MKLLVFSDSHRSLRSMRDAVELEDPNYVIHLGDLEDDARLLSCEYPQLAMTGVPGNCDGFVFSPLQKVVTYEGIRILMSHGHIWGVKGGYGAAIAAARKCDAHIVLFGHTHVPCCEQAEDGLWVMNPGSIRDSGSYGIITISDKNAVCELKRV